MPEDKGMTRRHACRAGLMTAGALGTAMMLPAQVALAATTWEDVVVNSLGSQAAFDAAWIRGVYPWGDDTHNGSAKMRAANTVLYPNADPGLSFVSMRGQRDATLTGNSAAPFYRPLHYYSGVMYLRQTLVINATYPQYEIKGQFRGPTARGTWPAFWVTSRDPWPPESDILEFKGGPTNYFNTFNETSVLYQPQVLSTPVTVNDTASVWHEYRVWIEQVNATDVAIHYYLDGQWKAQHLATNWVGKPLFLIMNLQMEGDSGEPGPAGDTYFEGRRIYVGRTRAS